jgi:putative ABC transport system permease protein
MTDLFHDARLALRALRRQPGFAAAAMLTLALGIGTSTAVFSLLHAVLLRPLPFRDPGRLVAVWERRGESRDADIPVSAHEYVAWKERNRVFSDLALAQPAGATLTGVGEPVTIRTLRVSTDYFPMLGLVPTLGRAIVQGDDRDGNDGVAVVSDQFWRLRLGADPRAVGSTITLDDRPVTVVGVMPPLPEHVSPGVWLPLDVAAEARAVGRHNLQVIARLRDGITLAQARADLGTIAGQLARELPGQTDHGVAVQALRDTYTGSLRLPLLLLSGAVGCVLLIACVNVANLLLARATHRHHELTIRAALGAGRARLMRLQLTESLMLAASGAGLGVLLAGWMVAAVPRITAVTLPLADLAQLDGPVLGVALGLALLTGVATGLVPSLRVSSTAWADELRVAGRISDDRGRQRVRSALVAAEVALALVLLIGTGLLAKSFIRLLLVDPGFTPRQALVLPVDLPETRYPAPERRRAFLDDLLDRLDAVPGVTAAGAISQLPLGGADNWMPFAVEGRPDPAPGQELYAQVRVVTPEYFRAIGIPLREGRFFTPADARRSLPLIRWYAQQPQAAAFGEAQAPPVALISEAAARQHWPGEDPIGRRIRVLFSPEITIVGVVGDVRHNALNAPSHPHIYLPHAQEPWGSVSVVVRTSLPPLRLAGAVREQVRALDPSLPVSVRLMKDVLAASVGPQRLYALLVGGFGLAALGLAVIGVFGVVSYTAAQRTREIGVRTALGASRRDVYRLIIAKGMQPSLAGVLIGLAGAVALSGFLGDLLYDVPPTDPLTYAGVALLMTLVVLLACWVPARRAAGVDPVEALRHE